MVFLPSITRFRARYLEESLATAHIAILSTKVMPEGVLDQELKRRLLRHADTYAIEEKKAGIVIQQLRLDQLPPIDATVTLPGHPLELIIGALVTLPRTENRILQVTGPSKKEPDLRISIIIDEKPMREAMIGYSVRILILSLVIALFTGMLVYFSLRKLIVTPIQHLTANIQNFRQNPEDPDRIVKPGTRSDEVGIMEKNLAFMQRDIRASLTQKTRLAAIGEAVAKVNHDLRNILANAMLQGDKLARIRHPQMREILPILFETIEDAVTLCRRTLDFVSNPQEQFQPQAVNLHIFMNETLTPFFERQTHDNSSSGHLKKNLRFENMITADLSVTADPQQLSRVVLNLVENSIKSGADMISFRSRRTAKKITLFIRDNGPGIPSSIRSDIFRPFSRSKKSRGTGLGLAIVKDIMQTHNGDIGLRSSTKYGTVFALSFPVE